MSSLSVNVVTTEQSTRVLEVINKGPKGDPGPQGIQGDKGDQGDPGPAGPPGSNLAIIKQPELPTTAQVPLDSAALWLDTDTGQLFLVANLTGAVKSVEMA